MLGQYLARFPSRPRAMMLEYARPRLVNWQFPVGVDANVEREPHYGLVKTVRIAGADYEGWAMAGESFGESQVTEWSVTVLERTIFLGITNRSEPWFSAAITGDETSSCFELRHSCECDNEIELVDVKLSGHGHAGSSWGIYEPGRSFTFTANLPSNRLTVSFVGFAGVSRDVSAFVPDLASHRPFCFFSNVSHTYLIHDGRPQPAVCFF